MIETMSVQELRNRKGVLGVGYSFTGDFLVLVNNDTIIPELPTHIAGMPLVVKSLALIELEEGFVFTKDWD